MYIAKTTNMFNVLHSKEMINHAFNLSYFKSAWNRDSPAEIIFKSLLKKKKIIDTQKNNIRNIS